MEGWTKIEPKQELKKCPFCGGKAELLVDDATEAGDTTHPAKIRCANFGCRAQICSSLSITSQNMRL